MSNGPPFEFRALESVLISVSSSLYAESEVLVKLVSELLLRVEEEIHEDLLKELLRYSKRLSRFEQKVLTTRDAIMEVLEQDEDLAAMYLTDQAEGKQHAPGDHQDVELLLEAYLTQLEEVANQISRISFNMAPTNSVASCG
jgi:magnesium transporter